MDWVAGDEIVITTTGKSAYEGEIRSISSVSADQLTLTLNEPLTYKHAGYYTCNLHIRVDEQLCLPPFTVFMLNFVIFLFCLGGYPLFVIGKMTPLVIFILLIM